jgi:hypothetical protein
MIRTPEELRYVPVRLPHVALTEWRPKPGRLLASRLTSP